jgi:hypothetical protein
MVQLHPTTIIRTVSMENLNCEFGFRIKSVHEAHQMHAAATTASLPQRARVMRIFRGGQCFWQARRAVEGRVSTILRNPPT